MEGAVRTLVLPTLSNRKIRWDSTTLSKRKIRWDSTTNTELPTEILDKIFSYVSAIKTLRNVALCCRRFHDVVMPYLFRSIYVPFSPTDGSETSRSPSRLPIRDAILCLLRKQDTIQSALHVRLRSPLVGYKEFDDELDFRLERAVRSYLKQPENASTKLAHIGTSWLSFARDDHITLVVLFLALLPRIQSLHIGVVDEMFLGDRIFTLNVFEGLKKITFQLAPVSTHSYDPFKTIRSIRDILHIESLVSFCLVGIHIRREQHSLLSKFPPAVSSVKHFEYRESGITHQDLVIMLTSFKSLETFVYERDSTHKRRQTPYWQFLFVTMMDIVTHTSVHSVWIDFSRDIWFDWSFINPNYSPTDVSGLLPKLKHLRQVCLPLEFVNQLDLLDGRSSVSSQDFREQIETLIMIRHFKGDSFIMFQIWTYFLKVLANSRIGNSDNTYPSLRFVGMVMYDNDLKELPSDFLSLTTGIPDLEVMVAVQDSNNDEVPEDLTQTRKLHEIQDSMGFTRLRKNQWKVIDKAACLKG